MKRPGEPAKRDMKKGPKPTKARTPKKPTTYGGLYVMLYSESITTTNSYKNMIHRAALKYAGKGKPVFPCKPDKKPYTPHGFYDTATDPGRVTALWTLYEGEMIGMPTGEASGVFVVDVDRLEALEELDPDLLQALRETLTIRTPSGGLHFYLNHIAGITNKRGTLPAGIDIRGTGGYVIVPPSEGYTVKHRAQVADAPEKLLEALREAPRKQRASQGRSRESVPDGGDLGGPIPLYDRRHGELCTRTQKGPEPRRTPARSWCATRRLCARRRADPLEARPVSARDAPGITTAARFLRRHARQRGCCPLRGRCPPQGT